MKRLLLAAALLSSMVSYAQNSRINTNQTIGWYNTFATFQLKGKWSLHGEYQWRRDQLISHRQQGLLRVGLNYRASPKVLLRAGYAWIETYPYGELPINALGRDFTEHRFFQMVQLSDQAGRSLLQHRFMLEQRLIGRYSSGDVKREDEFPLSHRIRYMFRWQLPLTKKATQVNNWYLAAYDEIFIGFGKNVNANVFDQNRFAVLFGYGVNKHVRIEAGYLNQVLQFGREINGRQVFQYNNGIITNAIVSF